VARRFKPQALKIIQGSKRLLPHPEPQPEGDLVEAPAWLTDSQKEGWNYAIKHAPPGLLKRLDRSILTIWVIAEDCHKTAAMKVNEHGMLIKLQDGTPMQSPYLSIQNRQSVLMMKAAAEMGFSPSSRAGIAAGPSGTNSFSNNGPGGRPRPA
jgi:P27 family predicted phage terminase small subunit